MILADIKERVKAHVVWGHHLLDSEIKIACGADLMSDVLAIDIKPNTLLITSLVNAQVMRTAEMVEITAVLFVRGKTPDKQVVNIAREVGIPLLSTDNNMFDTCGSLYQCGLTGCW